MFTVLAQITQHPYGGLIGSIQCIDPGGNLVTRPVDIKDPAVRLGVIPMDPDVIAAVLIDGIKEVAAWVNVTGLHGYSMPYRTVNGSGSPDFMVFEFDFDGQPRDEYDADREPHPHTPLCDLGSCRWC